MQLIVLIALGGALGAVLRHLIAVRIAAIGAIAFPVGIMSVNIFGSFLMGLIVSLFAFRFQVSNELKAFLTVGLLGGFTTFSAFSLEAVSLIERNEWGLASFYVFGSVAFALIGFILGQWMGRLFA